MRFSSDAAPAAYFGIDHYHQRHENVDVHPHRAVASRKPWVECLVPKKSRSEADGILLRRETPKKQFSRINVEETSPPGPFSAHRLTAEGRADNSSGCPGAAGPTLVPRGGFFDVIHPDVPHHELQLLC